MKLLMTIGGVLAAMTMTIAPAQADVPMEINRILETNRFTLTVPGNTTESAYGGRLRLYDVHIAKMVEVTDYYCSKGQLNADRSVVWNYYANSGDTNMGTFKLSCGLSRDLAIAYGIGRLESTLMRETYRRRSGDLESVDIPSLNIKGGKVDSWLRFAGNLKPVY